MILIWFFTFKAYKSFIVETAVVMTRETGANVPVEDLRKSAEELFEFETQLAKVSFVT